MAEPRAGEPAGTAQARGRASADRLADTPARQIAAHRCRAAGSLRHPAPPPSTTATRNWRRPRGRGSILASFARDARRMLTDPDVEQAKDTWDLAVFGHPGGCRSPRSASPGCPTRPSGGLPSSCRTTEAAVPREFAEKSTTSGGCPNTSHADPTVVWIPPHSGAPIWKGSSTGRPPGSHRTDRPLPTQHDLPRRAPGARRNPIPGPDHSPVFPW